MHVPLRPGGRSHGDGAVSVPRDGKYGAWAGKPEGTPEDKTRCQEQVHESGRAASFYQCSRRRSVVWDGHHYCKQHDPVAVKAREDKREKQWRDESARQDRRIDLKIAKAVLVDAVMAWYSDGGSVAASEALYAACRAVEASAGAPEKEEPKR